MEEESCDLRAQIKADIFREIFDNMTKNMKQNQKIYFIFNQKQMKLWMREASKAAQLELKIDSKFFSSYNCRRLHNEQFIIRKFQLKKFLYFPSFFQSCKGQMKMFISEEKITFKDSNGLNRRSEFPVHVEQNSLEEENEITNTDIFGEKKQKNYCQLTFPKARVVQQVIHSGNTMKVERLFLSYLMNEKKLKFEFKKNDGCQLKVKAQQIQSVGKPISKISFAFKKLKLAMGLLQGQKPFIVRLSENNMLIDFDQSNKKKYNVRLLAELDEMTDD